MTGVGGAAGAVAPDEGPGDAALLAAHVAGDPLAFAEIVRRHSGRMWAVALRTTRDPEEAADALQEAFLSAHRGAASFRADAQVSTWLHRIVVNACLDRLRRRAARPTVPLPEDPWDEPADPRDAVGERDTRMLVQHALLQIPADQRAAVVAVDVEGYSVADAARLLGVAEGTVKSRCARGRAKLAVLLGHLRDPDAEDPAPPAPTRGNRTGAGRVPGASTPRGEEQT